MAEKNETLEAALSSGGAVIISQYIGGKREKEASSSASQLSTISAVISLAWRYGSCFFRDSCCGFCSAGSNRRRETYSLITTLSLPFMAVYDAGAALCRSIGKNNVTPYVSLAASVLNVIGNRIGVFVLRLDAGGVAFVALPCVFRRGCDGLWLSQTEPGTVSKGRCAALGRLSASKNHEDCGTERRGKRRPSIGEGGLSGMIALFGTDQVTANGMVQSIWSGYGAEVYDGDWPVLGRTGYGRGE